MCMLEFPRGGHTSPAEATVHTLAASRLTLPYCHLTGGQHPHHPSHHLFTPLLLLLLSPARNYRSEQPLITQVMAVNVF